jgi:hypothetical protein
MAPKCQGPYHCPGCATCASIAAPRGLTASEERRIQRALRNDPPIYDTPRPVRLRVVTMPADKPAHDPAACRAMVCDEPECLAANARRTGPYVRQPWQVVRRAA